VDGMPRPSGRTYEVLHGVRKDCSCRRRMNATTIDHGLEPGMRPRRPRVDVDPARIAGSLDLSIQTGSCGSTAIPSALIAEAHPRTQRKLRRARQSC
jgi:hypothetical protein